MKHARVLIALLFVTVSCASSEASKPRTPDPSASTVALTTSTTSTTVLTFVSNLDVHIDPAIESLPEINMALDAVLATEQQYAVRPGTVALFYGSSDSSIEWAQQKAQELNCFTDIDSNGFRNSVGWGRNCGFLMRIDGINFGCNNSDLCKQGRTVAAHEFFHVAILQLLEGCICEPKIWGNKVPNWLNEGIADYVGYAMVYGSTPGSLQPTLIDNLRVSLKDRASDPAVAVGVVEMEELWATGYQQPWFGRLYSRSFLAVTLLVEKFGEDAVLRNFFANVNTAGEFSAGFEKTFGISEADFDAEFQTWIQTL